VAPPEVLGALQRFLAYTSYRNPDKDLERHDELFNELIKVMRRDLWPKARSNNSGRQFWLQAVPPATEDPSERRKPRSPRSAAATQSVAGRSHRLA
jgi:hypothetical protein